MIWFSVFWSSAFGSHPLDALNGSNVTARQICSCFKAVIDLDSKSRENPGGSNVDVWHFHQPIDVRCFELHIIDFHI